MATGSNQPSPPLPPPPIPTQPPFVSPPFTVILTLVILVFFFAGFFSIYFCRCFLANLIHGWYVRHNPGAVNQGEAAKPAPGLDPHIVQSYPTFSYSSVKGYRREKYGLECAICLIEFEDVDVLRLLTPCCHVFHQECIDLWLESHKTCPVCRRDLELENDDDSPVKSMLHDIQEDEEDNKDSVSITIRDDNNQDYLDEKIRKGKFIEEKGDGEEDMVDKFSRSHSTGHDSVVIGNSSSGKEEDEDRYKLRLPDHVKSNIIKSHHNATRSCTTFGEYKKSKVKEGNVIQGEVSGLSTGV